MKTAESATDSFWANLFKTSTEKSELDEVLLSMPPFQNLTPSSLKEFEKLLHDRVYSANEIIFHQGDPGTGLFIITKGEVIISQESDDDKWELAILGKGDFFGELALLDNERRSATATSLKETHLAVIFKQELDNFIETFPKEGNKILRGISQIIATRLRNLNQDYFSLYNKSRNK